MRLQLGQPFRLLAQAMEFDLVRFGERLLLLLELGQRVEPQAPEDPALLVHHLLQAPHQGHQDRDLLERLHHVTSWVLSIS